MKWGKKTSLTLLQFCGFFFCHLSCLFMFLSGSLCCQTAQSLFSFFQTQSLFNLQNEVSYWTVVPSPGSLCPPAFLPAFYQMIILCCVKLTRSLHLFWSLRPLLSLSLSLRHSVHFPPCYSTPRQNATASSRLTGLMWLKMGHLFKEHHFTVF